MKFEHFELGKSYIVDVTKIGIIPIMEFDNSKWYNTDQDDLDFLTDEEKTLVINDVLDKIRLEIETEKNAGCHTQYAGGLDFALSIIDKYKAESEESDEQTQSEEA